MNNDQRIATLVLHGWEPCGSGESDYPWVGIMKVGFGTLWMYGVSIDTGVLDLRRSMVVYTHPISSDSIGWADIPPAAISKFFNSEEL